MMPETSNTLFYNSENGDRLYDADSFEHLLKKFFTSGVFAGSCQVTADGSGMGCTMDAGYSNCDGKIRFFTQAEDLALQNAHATYDRIDTIVIERNDSDREITAKVVTGNYSASPIPVEPVRTGGVYQLVIAEIYVSAGAVRITQADITDKRPDTSVCGYVMCAVDTPDFSELYAQFSAQAEEWLQVSTADFEAWYDHMKDQLDDDAAGHLQGEIDAIDTRVDALEADAVIKVTLANNAPIPIPAASEAVRYDVTGMTAAHEVVRWNFSSSAENSPPCDLTITTYDGYFTITNTSGTTSESIKPVFAVPSVLEGTRNNNT